MRRAASLAVALLLLAGCGLAPFETLPRPPFRSDDQTIPRVGICYSALFSTPEEVRMTATEACSGLGKPRLVEQDTRLACPLLTPTRATFACDPE
jgi:hypothetical protein